MFNNTNYDQQMTMYYKYSLSQVKSISNTQNNNIMLRKIFFLAIVTIICLVALFSSLTLFVIYDTMKEVPLTDADIAFAQECKITLSVSVVFLLVIFIGYHLNNAVELKE